LLDIINQKKSIKLPSSQDAINKGMRVIRFKHELLKSEKVTNTIENDGKSKDVYSSDDWKLRQQLGF